MGTYLSTPVTDKKQESGEALINTTSTTDTRNHNIKCNATTTTSPAQTAAAKENHHHDHASVDVSEHKNHGVDSECDNWNFHIDIPLAWGVVDMQGWRKSMEDAHVARTDVPIIAPATTDKNSSHPQPLSSSQQQQQQQQQQHNARVFGVFDGHGGPEVARFCSLYLVSVLSQQDTWNIHLGQPNHDHDDADPTAVVDHATNDENSNDDSNNNDGFVVSDVDYSVTAANSCMGQALIAAFHAMDRMIDDPARRDELILLRSTKPELGTYRDADYIPPVAATRGSTAGTVAASSADTTTTPTDQVLLHSPTNQLQDKPLMLTTQQLHNSNNNTESLLVPQLEMEQDDEDFDDSAYQPVVVQGLDGVIANAELAISKENPAADSISTNAAAESVSTIELQSIRDSEGLTATTSDQTTQQAAGMDSSANNKQAGNDADGDNNEDAESDEVVGQDEAVADRQEFWDQSDEVGDSAPATSEENPVTEEENQEIVAEVAAVESIPISSASTGSGKVTSMFQRLLNMSGAQGQVVLQVTGAQPGSVLNSNTSNATIAPALGFTSAGRVVSGIPCASQPTMVQNGRLICNLPDHPVHAGATAIVAVIVGHTLTVANAGDSRAVLCRHGIAIPLSFDHKPTQDREMQRIQKAGGFVTSFGRVNGNLNLSRSIGDLKYKQVPGIAPPDQMITAEPDITQVKLIPGDEFIIMGCDGIWDCLTNEKAVEYVRSRIDTRTPTEIGVSMLDEILSEDPRVTQGVGGDNMTIMIIDLQPTKRRYRQHHQHEQQHNASSPEKDETLSST